MSILRKAVGELPSSRHRSMLTPYQPRVAKNRVSDEYECRDYLHSMEIDPKRRPNPDYLENVQIHIKPAMREMLVDWLIDLSHHFHLLPNTLFLAVNYVDRYLSFETNIIVPAMLQLLGVSCLFLASKFEQPRYTLPEEKFASIKSCICTKQELLVMASEILNFFKFGMWDPTPLSFLTVFSTAQPNLMNRKLEFLSCYLAELTLLDYSCLRFLPSLIAASVIFLANFMVKPDQYTWNLPLQHRTGYKPSDLKECVLLVHSLRLKAPKDSLVAVSEKYSKPKFNCVASIACPAEILMEYFEDMPYDYLLFYF